MTQPMNRPAQRILFISAWLPVPGHWSSTAGVARRQQLIIDGLRGTGLGLDVLLLLPRTQFDGSAEQEARITAQVRTLWGDDVGVNLLSWQPSEQPDSLWASYIAPALNFHRRRDFARMGSAAMRERIARALRPETALVFCHHLASMMAELRHGLIHQPIVLDMDDIEHVSFARRISEPPVWFSKRLSYLQLPALLYAEYRAIRRARRTYVCSVTDQYKLNRLFRTRAVEALPNAMPLREIGPPSSEPTLMMLGHYSFAPNRQGANYFIKSVWPRVHAQMPSARLLVAGAEPELLEAFRSQPEGVTFTGYVKDLDALYRGTRVAVCPILSGGGTRLKIMEAAAYGRPVVSTRLGAEGIELKPGEEILLGDTPEQMAAHCLALLRDDELAQRIGQQAQQAIEARYSRERIVADLAGYLSSLIASEPMSRSH